MFEVRKIFKRPDDDKIKQEEIIKVKDAIDRCLNSYRRIKQEELEERDRQERIRRRREDIQKRAEAFKKQREEIEKNLNVTLDGETLGMDPFSFQKAKIAMERKRPKTRSVLPNSKRNKKPKTLKKRKKKALNSIKTKISNLTTRIRKASTSQSKRWKKTA
ncbi:MAG: hypothetical protein L6V83_01180 [Christensenella sp.]|nr:MAG: hypothetical protein L6V83_01180 [Christensenella sp.]